MGERRDVYAAPTQVTEAEKRYFSEACGHPNSVSWQLLERIGVKGVSVLDPACGPDPTVARMVERLGGYYFGADIRADALSALSAALDNFQGLNVDITNMPNVNDRAFDVVHTRFVLHAITSREDAIREVLRVTRRKAVFIERSWTKLDLQIRQPLLRNFVTLCHRFMAVFGVQPYAGERLAMWLNLLASQNMFVEALPPFRRNEGPFSEELVHVSRMMGSVAAQSQKGLSFVEPFETIARQIEEKPFEFIPPDIHAVVVTRR